MNYQNTVNLPQTTFAMKAGLAAKEPLILEKWKAEGLYEAIRAKAKGQKKFVLHDGPPYANGHIHIGHALNKILKDMIVKIKTMQGFDAPYVPGWDCHGLPIEHQLLKEMKAHKSEVEQVDFRRKAFDYAMKFVGIQRDEFKRLGVFGEWDHPYLTLDPQYEYWILRSLAGLNQKGYVYRGLKPVNWCPVCETALAEAEVEYEDHVSPSVYVKFKVENPQALKEPALKDKDVYLLIWTTTPWTLLANVAVAVHPGYHYVAVDVGGEVLILEKGLSVSVLAKGQASSTKVIKEYLGKDLTGLKYSSPLNARKACPIVAVAYVTKDEGTGLVHTAPGHGQEDYETGVKFKLDVVVPVNHRGVFTEEAGEFAGQHVFKANDLIIQKLSEQGILFCREDLSHSYPHCWRCKKPVIFRATKQWFVNIEHKHLRSELLKVVQDSVEWIPSGGEERIAGMIKTRPDWCLSRQRYWGVPIPALVCQGCHGEQKLFTPVIECFAEIVKDKGTDAWFALDVPALVPKGFVCPDCHGASFEKANDILDVWFDSGVSHQAVLKGMMHAEVPCDLYLEGSDQHRGWFQSSLIPSVALEGKAPYKAVLTHGFVVDGQGRKMSKSLGNVVAPQDIIKNYGADFLRLWVAASSYQDDIRISKEIMERLVDAYRKIRNTVRFMLSNLFDFDPDRDTVVYLDLTPLDQWALHRLALAAEAIDTAYTRYDFADAYKRFYAFCNEEMSGIYLDILKDRLYTAASHSPQRRAAQTVLFHILNVLVRQLAPVLAFTADEIFEAMPKGKELAQVKSVHLLSWPKVPSSWKNPAIEKDVGELVSNFRPHVLKALEEKRQEGALGSSLEAKVVIRTASSRDETWLKRFDNSFLREVFIVSGVIIERAQKVSRPLDQVFTQTEIVVEKAEGAKCPRCWNYSVHVGEDAQHPELCERCSAVMKDFQKT